jgi:hypothetical protein
MAHSFGGWAVLLPFSPLVQHYQRTREYFRKLLWMKRAILLTIGPTVLLCLFARRTSWRRLPSCAPTCPWSCRTVNIQFYFLWRCHFWLSWFFLARGGSTTLRCHWRGTRLYSSWTFLVTIRGFRVLFPSLGLCAFVAPLIASTFQFAVIVLSDCVVRLSQSTGLAVFHCLPPVSLIGFVN